MIKVFTNPTCVQCDQTKRYLDLKGIEYEVVDLSQDEEALNKVVELGYRSAPVVMTDDDTWSGFRLDKLSAL
jgi:glutaredoxin-like protein NrdH